MSNPLIESFFVYGHLLDLEGEAMHEVGGCAAFDPFDEKLSEEVADLISTSYNACADLSERARRARLNAIWRQFVEDHKPKAEAEVAKAPIESLTV